MISREKEILPLLRMNLTISDQLLDAIDHARGPRERNSYIEEQLRRCPAIKRAAEELKINWLPRRKSGRYPEPLD